MLGDAGLRSSNAGDVNGDGFDDVIVGAYKADHYDLYDSGSSYVVFGQASGFSDVINLPSVNGSTASFSPNLSFRNISGDTGFVIEGEQSGQESDIRKAGTSVSVVGDMNGDGYDDLIIAAAVSGYQYTERQGDSFVVFGKASQSDTVALSGLDGHNGFRLIGGDVRVVNRAGDVNGDGLDDFAVGS